MCRSPALYDDPDTFNPDRWLNPESPLYKEPLTEYPKLQGHSVFGWGRRSCIGQEYAASQMLVVCAAVAYAFNILPPLDKNGKPVMMNIDDATPHGKFSPCYYCQLGANKSTAIPIIETGTHILRFEPRTEAHADKIRNGWAALKTQDEEFIEDECA